MSRTKFMVSLGLMVLSASVVYGQNFTIFIDYSLDTNNFFSTPDKRAALQAAADRWSNIITSQLTAVGPSGTGTGTSAGWRIGFNNPATGASYEISTAANSGTDPIVTAGGGTANQYGFGGLAANQWILYAGGRALGGPAGIGGTGTGTNFTGTFNDMQGPMHRGVISNTPANTVNDIPAWGGSISFDTATTWNFNTAIPAPAGTIDLYSIALHEIGHALGLSVPFNQWTSHQIAATFTGTKAVSALNQDNGSALAALNLVSATNLHWADNVHKSLIFPLGSPDYIGTVGSGVLQDLLMDPVANFTGTLRRFEVTNVEVGAIQDLGWSVLAIPELSSMLYMGGILAIVGYGYSRRRSIAPTNPTEQDREKPLDNVEAAQP